MWIDGFAFCCKIGKCCKYTLLGGSVKIITILHMGRLSKFIRILHGGVFPIYYNITMGGGSLGTPNLYYVIYGRPLIAIKRDICSIQIFIQWNSNTANAEIALYD